MKKDSFLTKLIRRAFVNSIKYSIYTLKLSSQENPSLEDLTNRHIQDSHFPKVENTFFSSEHWSFAKRDHILGHKTFFHKIKKIKLL